MHRRKGETDTSFTEVKRRKINLWVWKILIEFLLRSYGYLTEKRVKTFGHPNNTIVQCAPKNIKYCVTKCSMFTFVIEIYLFFSIQRKISLMSLAFCWIIMNHYPVDSIHHYIYFDLGESSLLPCLFHGLSHTKYLVSGELSGPKSALLVWPVLPLRTCIIWIFKLNKIN